MRAIWRGDSDPLELINGKEYEILSDAWKDLPCMLVAQFYICTLSAILYLFAS